MTEETIYYLTKMYLEEVDKKQDKFVMTKKELIDFCKDAGEKMLNSLDTQLSIFDV